MGSFIFGCYFDENVMKLIHLSKIQLVQNITKWNHATLLYMF